MIYEIEWVEESLNRARIEASTREEALRWFFETDDYRVNVVASEVRNVRVRKEKG